MNTEIEKSSRVEEDQLPPVTTTTTATTSEETPEQQQTTQPQEIPTSRVRRIRRGLSARRYLRNLTKNWDQALLETFMREGKMIRDASHSATLASSAVVDHDLSLALPPLAYRFDQSWVSATVDMRSYKFIRAQDFDLTKGFSVCKNKLT